MRNPSPKYVPGDLVSTLPDHGSVHYNKQEYGIILETRQTNSGALRGMGVVGAAITVLMPYEYIVLCASGIRGPFEGRQLRMISPTTERVVGTLESTPEFFEVLNR